MTIKLTKVFDSSSVAALGYDKESQTMRVDYHGTGLYDYENITPFEYRSVTAAGSIGKALREVIKGKRFEKVKNET